MKVLVTGGAGFIGSHVVDGMLEAGYEVVIIDNLSTGKEENIAPQAKFYNLNLQDAELENIFKEERPDYVAHHAAQASVAVSVKNPILDAESNILGSINLLENCVRYGVKKVIFASSGGCVYGEADELPTTEEAPFKAPPSPYGITKITGEYYFQFYQDKKGLNYTTLRYANIYGPRQDPYGEAGVVAIFAQAMLEGRAPLIYAAKQPGDGGCIRDYTYVGDVVRANLLALEKGDNEAFNIGSGIGTKTEELFKMMSKIIGYTGTPRQLPPRPGDILRSTLSYAKAERILGWKPEVTLEEGLKKTIEHLKDKGLMR